MNKRYDRWLAVSVFTLTAVLSSDLVTINAQETTETSQVPLSSEVVSSEVVTTTPAVETVTSDVPVETSVLTETTVDSSSTEETISAVEKTSAEFETSEETATILDSQAIKSSQLAALESTVTTVAQPYTGYNKYEGINYRDAKTMQFAGKLTLGAKVQGTIQGLWVNFLRDGQSFLISKSLLSDTPIAYTGYSKYQGMNYRDASGTKFIGKLDLGQQVSGVIDELWVNAVINGQSAKVSKSLLSDVPLIPNFTGTANFNANYRDPKTMNFIGQLVKGEKVTGISQNGWVNFTRNGVQALVSKSVLTEILTVTPTPVPVPKPAPTVPVANSTVAVNLDVKLNGVDQLVYLNTTPNFSTATTTAAKTYFGQKFHVNKVVYDKTGAKFYELTRNGAVIGYSPASATVEVPLGKRTIYLDAGHGGTETGTVNFGKYEKNLNLNISTQLAAKLRALGYIVYETRTTDKTVPLTSRDDEPNSLMPDLFMSIHHNAMPASYGGSVNGIVTLFHDRSVDEEGFETIPYHPESRIVESKKFAQSVQDSLIAATGARNQGVRPQNLHVTRTTNVPAILVELGFLDNWTEHQKLISPTYQAKLINGLLNGVNKYFSL